ncbi:MAG TPA: hypothetical protein PLD23_20810 [Armatimonadota bacterium]|nr:hypothetical protein [Armatimonadota bacterium]
MALGSPQAVDRGLGYRQSFAEYPAGGKSCLDPLLSEYNASAGHVRWFVLRDLDHDEPCAPALVARLVRAPRPSMVLRVAVRAVEE